MLRSVLGQEFTCFELVLSDVVLEIILRIIEILAWILLRVVAKNPSF
jgi:hypothetical protein